MPLIALSTIPWDKVNLPTESPPFLLPRVASKGVFDESLECIFLLVSTMANMKLLLQTSKHSGKLNFSSWREITGMRLPVLWPESPRRKLWSVLFQPYNRPFFFSFVTVRFSVLSFCIFGHGRLTRTVLLIVRRMAPNELNDLTKRSFHSHSDSLTVNTRSVAFLCATMLLLKWCSDFYKVPAGSTTRGVDSQNRPIDRESLDSFLFITRHVGNNGHPVI